MEEDLLQLYLRVGWSPEDSNLVFFLKKISISNQSRTFLPMVPNANGGILELNDEFNSTVLQPTHDMHSGKEKQLLNNIANFSGTLVLHI